MKLADALHPESIKIPLMGSTKAEVIGELVDVLAANGLVDQHDEVVSALLDRERIMTTGVGKGVAIPHCKLNNLDGFSIALGIHPAGVDFQAIDEEAVSLVFLLTGPENEASTHIRLLSRISRLISNDEVRSALLGEPSPLAVYNLLKTEESSLLQFQS